MPDLHLFMLQKKRQEIQTEKRKGVGDGTWGEPKFERQGRKGRSSTMEEEQPSYKNASKSRGNIPWRKWFMSKRGDV